MPSTPLSVWTKSSGYNLGHIPSYGITIHSGDLVAGREYVIVSSGSSNFTIVGATSNLVGTVFVASGGITGTGLASETLIRESTNFNQKLPVDNDAGITYTKISGTIPPGLRIEGNRLIGTPYSVSDYTKFNFCIRATDGSNISDRTFFINVDGPDDPTFVTSSGSLAIGTHSQYYVLDKTYIDYQIEAFDLDTAAGQTLNFFIASGDGKLPPGLTMTSTGRISGFILPAVKIKPADGTGTYDNSYYDAAAYDFALRPSNGYDSYIYDRVFYDYNLPQSRPTSLNINYQFKVTLTDGNSYAQRIFKIFVIGDDQFRADSTLSDGLASGLFTADVTYLRQPAWLTKTNIGLFRANNYLTIPISLYDPSDVYYQLEYVNQEVKATSINILPTDNVKNYNFLTVTSATGIPRIDQYAVFSGIVENASEQLYRITSVTPLANNNYRLTVLPNLQVDIPNGTSYYIGSQSVLPKGTSFDVQTATIYGAVPYQPAITKNYNFTITAIRLGDKNDSANSSRTFTIGIIGEIDSVIKWNTSENLGTINANFISTLKVSATSTITDAVVLYTLTGGKLPPGLALSPDGEIIGKVTQFWDPISGSLGLTRFFDQPPQVVSKVFTTFDNGTTTIDKRYTFTIEAKDQYDYSATNRTFTVLIDTPNSFAYSNLRTRPFLKTTQRDSWKSFINDTAIFTPSSIYRTNDPNFGVQVDLSMIVYAGIETKSSAEYISAMGLNHKRKRFAFGSIKTATAYTQGTKNAVYEVVYAEMIDLDEPNGKHLPSTITVSGLASNTITMDNSTSIWGRSIDELSADAPGATRPEPFITVDSTGYQASNPNTNRYFPNSITNWRQRIKSIGATERNYLPLWMRSIQPGGNQELGFVLAVPICYCKVGTSADILLNIKQSGFNFKVIDYTADRYIIDGVTGTNTDKYLVFRNDRITV
jgi:hypothetical protein